MDLCFIFLTYLPYFIAKGVFGDEVKSVSVTEGHSVTLHTDVIKQKNDLIVWSYGPENTVVARINGKASSTKLSEDEMFIDRLKMNHQTGDLTISDVRTQHSGLYTLRISSNNKVSYKTFNLTVNGHLLPLNHIKHDQDLDNTELCLECSESSDQRLIVITAVCCTAVLCVIIIIIIIISVYMKKRKVSVNSSESKNHLTDEIKSINSISTCEEEESSKCLNEKQQHWIEAGSV